MVETYFLSYSVLNSKRFVCLRDFIPARMCLKKVQQDFGGYKLSKVKGKTYAPKILFTSKVLLDSNLAALQQTIMAAL